MNREETSKVLTILKINYPQSFRSYTNEETYALLDLWTEAFKNDDAAIVNRAIKSIVYSDTREFAPNIAQVKVKIYDLIHEGELDEQEAWLLARNAMRHNGEQARKEFNKLPEVVKKTIGDYGQLISWALADTSQLSYIQQKFFKDFSKTKEIEKNKFVNQLTTSNKKLIGGSYE